MAGGSSAELRERVQKLEEFVANPPTDVAHTALSVKLEELRSELQRVRTVQESHIRETEEKVENLAADVGVLADELRTRLGRLDDDAGLLKKAWLNAGNNDTSGAGVKKYRIPEPKAFAGARSAKELENFVYDMEQYFKTAHINEMEKVAITTMYLCDDAKLWWRTRTEDKSRSEISSWSELKKELRDQFLPANSGWQAREALRRVKHDKTVRDYVKEFTSVMLDVKGMSEEDKVFNFVSNLQPWAQAELRRQGVRDFQQAVAAADSLVDLKLDRSDAVSSKSKGKDKVVSESGKDGGTEHDKGNGADGHPNKGKGGYSGCFICKGSHRAKDCPTREKLAAIQMEESRGGSNSGAGDGGVNSLVLLGGLQAKEFG